MRSKLNVTRSVTFVTLIFLLISLCPLYSQNVGVGTNDPQDKLHVAGDIRSDSTLIGASLFLRDTDDEDRIRMNADSGSLEFWSNDTLWYRLKIGSPPEELLRSGNYSINEHFDDQGNRVIDYINEEGEVVATEETVFTDELNGWVGILRTYQNNCLKEEVLMGTQSGPFDRKRIVYDCPSGDTCYVEEASVEVLPPLIPGGPQSIRDNVTRRNVKGFTDYYHGDLMGVTINGVVVPGLKSWEEFSFEGVPKSSITDLLLEDSADVQLGLSSGEEGHIILDTTTFKLSAGQPGNRTEFGLTEEEIRMLFETLGGEFMIGNHVTDPGAIKLQFGFGGSTLHQDNRPAEHTIEYHTGMPTEVCTLSVDGLVNKLGGSFRIDHPLDPYEKYLFHSFVESPDMMNVYNGNITTDSTGLATVILPQYFEALNEDFRYQLTTIGSFARVTVKEKIHDNRFVIQSDMPGVEVSWQVTGIRHDQFAEDHRIQVEVDKEERQRGKLLYVGKQEVSVNGSQ